MPQKRNATEKKCHKRELPQKGTRWSLAVKGADGIGGKLNGELN